MVLTIIEDSRQQRGKHEHKLGAWAEGGIVVVRSKLPWGDYALPPARAVDSKRDILELHADVTAQHERFRRELAGARDAGCELTILTENRDGVRDLADLADWLEPIDSYMRRLHRSPKAKRIGGWRIAKACETMADRYGARFEFCRPDEAAGRILEILTGGAGDGQR